MTRKRAICGLGLVGAALATLLILLPARASSTSWNIVCHATLKGRVPGYKFTHARFNGNGDCEYLSTSQPTSITQQPVVSVEKTITKAVLDGIRAKLDLGKVELARLGLGAPLVNDVRVYHGDFLCSTKGDCCPVSGVNCSPNHVTIGQYDPATDDLFVSGTEDVAQTLFHELFHSVEEHRDGFVVLDPKRAGWIAHGIAEGFALHMLDRLGAPAKVIKRDYTKSLDLGGDGYSSGEFWYGAKRTSAGSGDFAHVKTIMDESGLSSGTGVAAVHEGFKKRVSRGLETVFREFVALYLNVEDHHKPTKKLKLNLRNKTKRKKSHSLRNIKYLATKGALLVLKVKQGQRIEVKAKIAKDKNDRKLWVALSTISKRSVASMTIDVCGGADDVEIPLRLVNTSLPGKGRDSLSSVVEIEARVVERNVCQCSVEKLAFKKEILEEQVRTGEPVRTYVRLDVNGSRRVLTSLNRPRNRKAIHTLRLGDRRHMGKKVYKNFPRVQLQASVRGLDAREFYLKFPIEGVGAASCRRPTAEERKNRSKEPIGEVDFCSIAHADLNGNRFESESGRIQIDHWDEDCWIAGRFDVVDANGKTAKGVFAFDVGYTGHYDVRTKKTKKGRQVKKSD